MTEQGRYQVRFEWTPTGAHTLAEATDLDVIIWVDAIQDADDVVRLEVLPEAVAVVEASIDTAGAVARWVVQLQHHLSRRVVVAVIAAGRSRDDNSTHFAVEDLLAAGAIIDQLARVGLDATSPEAAVAEAAYLHLRPAVAHLVSASVKGSTSGRRFVAGVESDRGPEDVLLRRHHSQA